MAYIRLRRSITIARQRVGARHRGARGGWGGCGCVAVVYVVWACDEGGWPDCPLICFPFVESVFFLLVFVLWSFGVTCILGWGIGVGAVWIVVLCASCSGSVCGLD